MLMSGVVIVYTLRVNMSVAAPKMKEELGWSETEKGYVLSAFYWGYALGQIPFSRLAQASVTLQPMCAMISITSSIYVITNHNSDIWRKAFVRI